MILAFAGLVLLVFGSKLWIIARLGSVVPYWDQWDAEADQLYTPYVTGALGVRELFAAHNEHRIVLTRLLNLGLLELAGSWDTIWQMCVNAGIHASALAVLLATCTRGLEPSERVLTIILTAAAATIPMGWENTLAGFQSQFYLLLLTTIVSLAILVHAEAFSLRWFVGVGFGLLSSLCMASGALTLVAGGVVAALQILLGARRGAKEWGAMLALVLAAGLVLATVPRVAGHDVLRATSIGQFLWGIVTLLALPLSAKVQWIILLPLPIILLVCLALVTRGRSLGEGDWLRIAIGAWTGLQFASIAFSRASGVTSSRYLDIAFVFAVLNLLAAMRLARSPAMPRMMSLGLLGIWLTASAAGFIAATLPRALTEAEERGRFGQVHAELVRETLQTGAVNRLTALPPHERPYPDVARLSSLLAHPVVRGLLPRGLTQDDAARRSVTDQLLLRGCLAELTSWVKALVLKQAGPIAGLGIAFLSLALLAAARGERRLAP